ncbi:MAG: low molecular weight protein arginine phosphatase [Eubacteriales bacterium]|nr:low molecular weight protein arginine phosphatase [Eubacteriales bacterium]
MKIIFACSGNTCRSPMAEALFRKEANALDLAQVEVDSAGLLAQGERASVYAVEALRPYGLDIDFRMSKQLDVQLVRESDLVLTMTRAQKQYLQEELPTYADIILTLGEFVGTGDEVSDPYNLGRAAYERCAAQLSVMVKLAAEKVKSFQG